MSLGAMNLEEAAAYVHPDPTALAEEKNLELIASDETHLQLDLDSEPYVINQAVLQALEVAGLVDPQDYIWTNSPGGNRHYYLRLTAPLPLEVRIALQAALGSDPRREVLSLIRGAYGPEHRRMPDQELQLFETRLTAKYVLAWLAKEEMAAQPAEDAEVPF